MNRKEYRIVCDSLINIKYLKIDTVHNYRNEYFPDFIDTVFILTMNSNRYKDINIRNYYFKMYPLFVDGKLVQISLSTNSIDSVDCIDILNLCSIEFSRFSFFYVFSFVF